MEDEERRRKRKYIYMIQSQNNSAEGQAYFMWGESGRQNSDALLFNQLGCSKLEWP
jgi:hypothetical protein